jgi:hypothetical protein
MAAVVPKWWRAAVSVSTALLASRSATRGSPASRQRQEVEDGVVGEHDLGGRDAGAVAHGQLLGVEAGGRLDLGHVAGQHAGQRAGRGHRAEALAAGDGDADVHAERAIAGRQPAIVGELVAEEKREQDGAGQAEREAADGDRRVQPLRAQLAGGEDEVVAEHDQALRATAAAVVSLRMRPSSRRTVRRA